MASDNSITWIVQIFLTLYCTVLLLYAALSSLPICCPFLIYSKTSCFTGLLFTWQKNIFFDLSYWQSAYWVLYRYSLAACLAVGLSNAAVLVIRVSDPHHIHADPDLDPDPGFWKPIQIQIQNADPDPDTDPDSWGLTLGWKSKINCHVLFFNSSTKK